MDTIWVKQPTSGANWLVVCVWVGCGVSGAHTTTTETKQKQLLIEHTLVPKTLVIGGWATQLGLSNTLLELTGFGLVCGCGWGAIPAGRPAAGWPAGRDWVKQPAGGR